jgi:hypothetical protein
MKREDTAAAMRYPCPLCGARILRVKMPNGGLVHFEGRPGLGRIIHPCFNIGKGLSNRRDPNTFELELDDIALKSVEVLTEQTAQQAGSFDPHTLS